MTVNDQYTIHILLIMSDKRKTDICELLCIINSIISPPLTFTNTRLRGRHPCFMFGRWQIQIWVQVLNKLRVFLKPFKQMLGQCLKQTIATFHNVLSSPAVTNLLLFSVT